MELERLKKEVNNLNREQIVWFAARCSLRRLPELANRVGEFPFRRGAADYKIFAVFRAVNASIAMIERKHSLSDAASAAAAARAAADALAASDATYSDSTKAVVTADKGRLAARLAAAAATAAAIAAAGDASISDIAKIAATVGSRSAITNHGNITASFTDLEYLRKRDYVGWPELWHGTPPRSWNQQVELFLSGLHNIGLDYWADEFMDWVTGNFNQEKLDRCLFIPEATIKAGPKTMLIYLEAEELVRTAEARVVFLGEGEAGKTSLIRRLFHEKIRGDEQATPRVEILQRVESIDGSDTRVHYWDFGGQVIMHATHQFFLREKSVYVVVLDIRRYDNLEYWLDHVRVFAGGAPTLVVLNKVDLLPTGMESRPSFDLNKIRRRYQFVVDAVYPLSCKSDAGLEMFAQTLRKQITDSYILRPDMPVKWFQIKEELAKENLNFIPRARFDYICREQGLIGDDITTALKYLDILGVAIHFPALRHKDVVLNPEWITKAIYFIIWTSEKRHLNGKLNATTLKTLFAESSTTNELGFQLPEDKSEFLLDLMTEFKLAFKSMEEDGLYCVPMLAPTEEPPHDIPRKGGLQFVFSLPFLPPGLFYRFIAESGKELLDDLMWKTGAVLTSGENRVLVEYSDYERTITMFAHGKKPGNFLTVLRQRLMSLIGESYKELAYEPYIITPDGVRISWQDMLERYGEEGDNAKVFSKGMKYQVIDLAPDFYGGMEKFKNGREAELQLMRGVVFMINIDAGQKTELKQEVNVSQNNEQKNVQSTTVSNYIRGLIQLDSDLKGMERHLKRFKDNDPELAEQNSKELRELQQDIEELREDIKEFQGIAGDGPLEETKRTSILKRIKEGWNTFAERAKQCYYVTGMVAKIATAAHYVAEIDLLNLLKGKG